MGAKERCSTQSERPRKLPEGGCLHYSSMKAGTELPLLTWDSQTPNKMSRNGQEFRLEAGNYILGSRPLSL